MVNYYYSYIIYISFTLIITITGGKSWTETSAPEAQWASIACDNSGQYLTAVQYRDINGYNEGYVFTSSNGLYL